MTDTLKPQIYDYNSFADAVRLFNTIGGNLKDHTEDEFVEAIKNQAYRAVEEAEEIIAACEALQALRNGAEEDKVLEQVEAILDGVVDTAFVSIGLFELASEYLPVNSAAVRICHNNLTKFLTSLGAAEASAEWYGAQEVECDVEEVVVQGTAYYVIKRTVDGKIMKPVGYKNVDLSDLLEEVDD